MNWIAFSLELYLYVFPDVTGRDTFWRFVDICWLCSPVPK